MCQNTDIIINKNADVISHAQYGFILAIYALSIVIVQVRLKNQFRGKNGFNNKALVNCTLFIRPDTCICITIGRIFSRTTFPRKSPHVRACAPYQR